MPEFTASTAACVSVTPLANALLMLPREASLALYVNAAGFSVESTTSISSASVLLSPSVSEIENAKLSVPPVFGSALYEYVPSAFTVSVP